LLVEIIVVGLIAYRLWRLLAVDSITERLRPARGWLAEMWGCPWCLGTWISIGVAFLGAWLGYLSNDWLVVGIAAAVITGWLGDTL
jgi:hypothetical protein